MIVYSTGESTDRRSPSTVCAIMIGRGTPLCIVRESDLSPCYVLPTDSFLFPGVEGGYTPPANGGWPSSRRWEVTSELVNDHQVGFFGRDMLICHGWALFESLIEQDCPWYADVKSEMEIEGSRDWVVDLLSRWRSGGAGYLEVASEALSALDSSVGSHLALESADAYDVLAELTTVSEQPHDLAAYVDQLLWRL
ncbi:hypothetical protein [Gordonia jinhuaensis]|nr:hypothetical protein [Gordonia jinhuaensis]